MKPPSTGISHSQDPLIGQTVERYCIQRLLGRGGMGAVYQAQHEELGHLAAVKTILPHSLSDENARVRFVREARLLASVPVSGLVKIYNVGRLNDGTPYILMEYLEGRTLAHGIEEAPAHRLPLAEALAITEQVAVTLAQLHERGVIHRDLKPGNIMLVPDLLAPHGQRVKLFDLGIAKLVAEQAAETLTHGPLGTPLYMAPEVCAGEPAQGAADRYSLGCVLYEMLCGRTPHLDTGGNVMLKHLYEAPLSPRRHVADLPRAIEEFLLALLARHPDDRPTAKELVDQVQALRRTPQQAAWRRPWVRRHLRSRRLRASGIAIAIGLGMPTVFLMAITALAANLIPNWVPWPAVRKLLTWGNTVYIPGGTYVMGSTSEERQIVRELAKHYDLTLAEGKGHHEEEYQNQEPDLLGREAIRRTVQISPFEMDRYEVTNAAFADFLGRELADGRIVVEERCPSELGDAKLVAGPSCVYRRSDHAPYKNLANVPMYGGIFFQDGRFVVSDEDHSRPVVAVSWLAATEYCAAHGKQLPTEAQWEHAARRGNRRFPWGNEPPGCNHAILERCGLSGRFCACRTPAGAPALPEVGSMPRDRSLDGVYDLGGSVSEWTADWYLGVPATRQSVLQNPVAAVPGTDPADRGHRSFRGGSWTQDFLSARGAARYRLQADLMQKDVGFRCLRSAK